MNFFKLSAAGLLSLLVSTSGFAHGDEQPQHGGIIQSVRDVTYELVSDGAGVMLYVADHGNPVPTAGITGKLVLTEGPRKTEAPLAAVGENKLLAQGVTLASGQAPTAILDMPSGRSIVVQFKAK